MSDNTKIEWATLGLDRGASWNPIRARNAKNGVTGHFCEKVSAGCDNCYAESLNKRLGTGLAYKPGHRHSGAVEIYLDEMALLQPLHWRKPRGVFVCSMTDLFGDWVSDESIDRVLAVIALCPQHRFAVLTKRSKRMKAYFSRFKASPRDDGFITLGGVRSNDSPNGAPMFSPSRWPLPNLWLLVSAEDQQRADERIPDLLATTAAVRGVSVEPMLSAVDICRYLGPPRPAAGLSMIITGGESGPGARLMHPAWARDLRDQCAADGVAYFHKQNGEWIDADEWLTTLRAGGSYFAFDGATLESPLNFEQAAAFAGGRRFEHQSDGSTMIRVGKRRSGRLLDGREHNEFPEIES